MARSATRYAGQLGQRLLFTERSSLPLSLPLLSELKPCHGLLSVFEDCHNHVFANEGLLKEKIFHEMVKLLMTKLADERSSTNRPARFAITSDEYAGLLEGRGGSFLRRISDLFDSVKSEHPKLFPDESDFALRPLTLAYIVAQLQHISLSKTPRDVKGEAFQSFVYRHQRGDRGEYFTPHPIVRLAVKMISPQPNEMVIDPACGSGGFLIETIAHIARVQEASDQAWDRGSYISSRIRGMDFNPDIAQAARVRLAFDGGTGDEVLCSNALAPHEAVAESFDVVLTNPPFGSKGKVEDPSILRSYELARKWTRDRDGHWRATSSRLPGQTPEILFLERCLWLLRPGGRMAIVVPDGLLQNVSSEYVRAWLSARAETLAVVSIPQEAFVPYGTGIKTSVLLLRKLPGREPSHCFMARVMKVGYDVKGQPMYKRDSAGRIVRGDAGLPMIDDDINSIAKSYAAFATGQAIPQEDRAFTVPRDSLNSRLDVEHYLPSDRVLIERLVSQGAKRLGDIADILSEADDFRLRSDEEIRYISISDVDARTMQVVSQQPMRAHEAPSRATYRLRKGDIITAVSGASTGTYKHATALITEEEDGAICSNGLAVLRNIREVNPLFLLCYMRSEQFLRQVRRLMTGHAIPAISLDDLASVLVPVLPEAKQREVAESVGRIQALRREALRAGDEVISMLQKTLKGAMPG